MPVDCKARESLLNISISEASIPIGAMKKSWNKNFRRAIIIMIVTVTMIMYIIVLRTCLSDYADLKRYYAF